VQFLADMKYLKNEYEITMTSSGLEIN